MVFSEILFMVLGKIIRLFIYQTLILEIGKRKIFYAKYNNVIFNPIFVRKDSKLFWEGGLLLLLD